MSLAGADPDALVLAPDGSTIYVGGLTPQGVRERFWVEVEHTDAGGGQPGTTRFYAGLERDIDTREDLDWRVCGIERFRDGDTESYAHAGITWVWEWAKSATTIAVAAADRGGSSGAEGEIPGRDSAGI